MRRHLSHSALAFLLVGASTFCSPSKGLAEDKKEASKECSFFFRISRETIERTDEPISVQDKVDQVILGTRSLGTASTKGKLCTVVDEKSESPAIVLTASGRVESNTTGVNGPATLHSNSVTDFKCKARVTFSLDKGFVADPVEVESSSKLHVRDITSSLPGLRGRVVKRVAWKRSNEAQAEAEAIVTDLARKGIRRDMERSVQSYLRDLNDQSQSVRVLSALLPGEQKLSMDCGQKGLVTFYLGEKLSEFPNCEDRSPAEIWLRRTNATAAKPKWTDNIASMLGQVNTPNLPINTLLKVPQQLADSTLPVAIQGDWFVVRLGKEDAKKSLVRREEIPQLP